MLETNVLILDVDNLTDARYFAAWGVEIICFPLDLEKPLDSQLKKLTEITSWIEGPKILVQIPSAIDNDTIFELSQKLNPYGFLGKSFSINLLELFPNSAYYQLKDQVISDIKAQEQQFFLINDIADIKNLHKSTNKPVSLAIRASGEEIVGVKDFERVDRIFEYLEDAN